jgi:hypothetical protein
LTRDTDTGYYKYTDNLEFNEISIKVIQTDLPITCIGVVFGAPRGVVVTQWKIVVKCGGRIMLGSAETQYSETNVTYADLQAIAKNKETVEFIDVEGVPHNVIVKEVEMHGQPVTTSSNPNEENCYIVVVTLEERG